MVGKFLESGELKPRRVWQDNIKTGKGKVVPVL
jgi:hypothetical protein